MKAINLTSILLFVLCIFSNKLKAQDGYTYTLQHDGGYDFTIQAVPNSSSNTFATSVQSYGFTIILPDGITATITSSLGNGASATFFNGSDVGDSSIDGYLVTEALGSPISLPAPSLATNSDMVSFTVNGNPSSGTLYILENNSSIATAVTPLKSFMAADMVDDGMAVFPNVVDEFTSAVSGMSSFSFTTLGINTNELSITSMYPNPTDGIVNISGVHNLERIEIYNLNGQLIQLFSKNGNMQQIDVTELQSGVYLVNVQSKSASKTFKLIKR
ncbi:putative secreted protein (Por secretion system target) [Kordia periserrulae]|uniref:Putative secreted protein (Por secretion system target) n=1 Tax=Kordia periserrulae TaxID=701523 RepID=A0A2T6C6Z5_9FLAO|nr:T9SS type A sorting domain-containing protein [Kordia periserrulae]PTX64099.1 putative secreted protein (Por secretion system target) [Kordia periserrulae]